ncbi:MAG: MATE family efflux transporter, partial [Firmicutes bacterium]|nr:MATE family efflux transporter [Bacillota bacterium]
SYINYFGTDFSSGYSAYFKSELILFMPQQSISLATTTFVGQNFGAGNMERAKQGVRASMVLCLIPTVVLGALMMVFAPEITAFFNSDPAVMAYGAVCIRFITPFYLIHILIMIHTAALRGTGDTLVPMIIMVGCFVFLRQIYLYVMTNYIVNTPVSVLASYPVGWVVGTVLNAVRYKRMDFSARFAKLRD